MRHFPVRKHNRLKNYDYSRRGAYFVTICAKNHENLFGDIINAVGAASCRPQTDFRPQLNKTGQIVKDEIATLSAIYTNVTVDKYIIMPNHVHMIISILNNGRQDAALTISRMMNQWKRAISIKTGFSPWQKSFHDHIIRNEKDYCRIVKYIENNPIRWVNDCYCKNEINR